MKMIGYLYLIITCLFGISLVTRFVDIDNIYKSFCKQSFYKKIPNFLLIIPMGIIIGIMSITMINYFLIYLLSFIIKDSSNLLYPLGIIITIITVIILTIINITKSKQKITFTKNYYYYLSVLLIIIATSFLMFYSYHIKDGILNLGVTTFSDMAPHTAMTSSFGVGGNIPTSYMHFSSNDIKYHFMFYFFTGMLNYLGLPIDLAINIPSIMTMVSTLVLAGSLATLLSKKKISFLLTSILVLFRSSLNIILIIINLVNNHQSIIDGIFKSNEWSNITLYDNWGIWAINIYPNQRHLMLGMGCILIFIMLFLPSLISFFNEKRKRFKDFFFQKETWIFSKKDTFIIPAIIIAISLPYFHGSALIAGLLVLFGMAIASKKRLAYLLIAVVSIISSIIQTNIFSGGADSVISFVFKPGFILENASFLSVIKYLFIITGVILIIVFIYSIKKRKQYNYLTYLVICFLFPLIFAFTFQITREMLANHKFIQFTIILLDIIVAAFIAELIKKGIFRLTIVMVLLLLLTSTGISEWATYINMNQDSLVVNTQSEEIEWIKNNTDKNDVFLTPMWSINSFFLAGRSTFYGWPYYAWSAGYDTDKRLIEYRRILSGMNNNYDELVEYCKENNIKYLIDSAEYSNTYGTESIYYNQDFFYRNFSVVADFPSESIKILQLY